MPKVRRLPPTTPLGAWLERWLTDHGEWTHAALAAEVGVSKGLISQWVSGGVKKVSTPNLRGLARVTGEPFENLDRMVHGGDATPASGGRYITESDLEALVERASERAMRRLVAELRGDPAA